MQPLWKNSLAGLQKVKQGVTVCPSNSTPGYIPRSNENIFHTKAYTRMFIEALFIITKKPEIKCPYYRILCSNKKE